MKNLFKTSLTCLFLFLLLSSCTEEEILLPANADEVPTYTEFVTSLTQRPVIIEQNEILKNLVMNVVETSEANLRTEAVASSWQEFGPFTTSSTLTRTLENTRIILGPAQGYATGTYFCDVYRCSRTVTLPAGAVMLYETASQEGLLNYTNPNGPRGVSINQANNTYEFLTWSIVPKFNAGGADINPNRFPYPINLVGTTFTYKYLQNIP